VKTNDVSGLRFVVLPGRDKSPEGRSYVEGAFELWHRIWNETLCELAHADKINSDDFTRHDEVIALFSGDRAIATVSVSYIDLTMKHWRQDSYFEPWPESVLLDLSKKYPGPKVMIGCYFTVDPLWRRENKGVSIKRLMTSLSMEHLLRSSYDVMVGTMRIERGMEKLAYEFGAMPLVKGIEYLSSHVDLLIWDKKVIQNAPEPRIYEAEAAELYSNRIDLRYGKTLEFPRQKGFGSKAA